jgi:hypothetical protein
MARPIEATKPLKGEDAKALLESLEKGAPADEMARRIEVSKARLQAVERGERIIFSPKR